MRTSSVTHRVSARLRSDDRHVLAQSLWHACSGTRRVFTSLSESLEERTRAAHMRHSSCGTRCVSALSPATHTVRLLVFLSDGWHTLAHRQLHTQCGCSASTALEHCSKSRHVLAHTSVSYGLLCFCSESKSGHVLGHTGMQLQTRCVPLSSARRTGMCSRTCSGTQVCLLCFHSKSGHVLVHMQWRTHSVSDRHPLREQTGAHAHAVAHRCFRFASARTAGLRSCSGTQSVFAFFRA